MVWADFKLVAIPVTDDRPGSDFQVLDRSTGEVVSIMPKEEAIAYSRRLAATGGIDVLGPVLY